jgi:hypothetical protein
MEAEYDSSKSNSVQAELIDIVLSSLAKNNLQSTSKDQQVDFLMSTNIAV